MSTASWSEYLAANRPRFLEEMLEFLKIPSISALPEHAGDVRRAAEWVEARMKAAGIENVRIMPTGAHPVVYGDWLDAPGKPTIMIYGHFDTQPVDPVDLWSRPPFEPTVDGNRVYARGASDDKGNMLVPILAVEALLKTSGRLPVNVKFFFEGQEEIGSPQMPAFVAEHRDLLACDAVLSADGGQFAEGQPALTIASRGLSAVQIDVFGAKTDLHSGMYGGTIQNPIHALVRLLDSMRDKDGRILVEGFYDDVRPLTREEREDIARIPFDEAEYLASLGLDATFGEPGFTTHERAWARPTLEVNGIWGGFQGAGTKTVLPNEAHAKITCRLVADQDPDRVAELIERHVARHAPKGVRVEVVRLPGNARPYQIPADHPVNRRAAEVLEELYGREPYKVRTGGSIPVCAVFSAELGAYTVGFAFGLGDERAHAPDEFFRLDSWDLGQRAYCTLLERLAE